MIVIDSKASANVQVLQIEALLANFANKLHHQHRRVPEDVHLHATEHIFGAPESEWHPAHPVIVPSLITLVPCHIASAYAGAKR